MRAGLLVISAFLLSACGYSVSGGSDLLPGNVRTIAIPAFANLTNKYKLSDRIPGALTREFISRTRYSVVADPEQADAVLRGTVSNYLAFPTIFDQTTGRASGVQMILYLQLSLVDRQSGKVLFNRPNMEFRQRYEISIDQLAYFEESDVALERISQDVARTIVSAVREAF